MGLHHKVFPDQTRGGIQRSSHRCHGGEGGCSHERHVSQTHLCAISSNSAQERRQRQENAGGGGGTEGLLQLGEVSLGSGCAPVLGPFRNHWELEAHNGGICLYLGPLTAAENSARPRHTPKMGIPRPGQGLWEPCGELGWRIGSVSGTCEVTGGLKVILVTADFTLLLCS